MAVITFPQLYIFLPLVLLREDSVYIYSSLSPSLSSCLQDDNANNISFDLIEFIRNRTQTFNSIISTVNFGWANILWNLIGFIVIRVDVPFSWLLT